MTDVQALVWFIVTTFVVLTLMATGIYLAVHSYDTDHRHLHH